MRRVQLSVVIPVGKRVDDIESLHHDYRRGLDRCGVTYEMIYVLDGEREDGRRLAELRARGEPIEIIKLGRSFGEATALMVGFANAHGAKLMTLPAYFQVDSSDFPKLIDAAADADLVVAHRWPRRGTRFEALRRRAFHGLLRAITRQSFHDLGCNVRIMRRRVAKEITIYGDQHRLLPVLAAQQGFTVREVEVAQSAQDEFRGRYRLREYVHRLLDLFTVFFLTRFTKKPLRFFGMLGSATFAAGALFVAILIVQRMLFGMPLADRPALLLSCLLLVLGVQLFALGLLGELIIFTHAKDLKEYKVADVIEAPGRRGERKSEVDAGTAARVPDYPGYPKATSG